MNGDPIIAYVQFVDGARRPVSGYCLARIISEAVRMNGDPIIAYVRFTDGAR